MIIKEYIIQDPQGMHARPATNLIKLARQFSSDIHLQKKEKKIPVKSLINILGLGIKSGDTVSVIIQGDDESDAAAAMEHFFLNELIP